VGKEADKFNKKLARWVNQLGDSRIGWVDETINIALEDGELTEESVAKKDEKYLEYMYEKVNDAIDQLRRSFVDEGEEEIIQDMENYADAQEVMDWLGILNN